MPLVYHAMPDLLGKGLGNNGPRHLVSSVLVVGAVNQFQVLVCSLRQLSQVLNSLPRRGPAPQITPANCRLNPRIDSQHLWNWNHWLSLWDQVEQITALVTQSEFPQHFSLWITLARADENSSPLAYGEPHSAHICILTRRYPRKWMGLLNRIPN